MLRTGGWVKLSTIQHIVLVHCLFGPDQREKNRMRLKKQQGRRILSLQILKGKLEFTLLKIGQQRFQEIKKKKKEKCFVLFMTNIFLKFYFIFSILFVSVYVYLAVCKLVVFALVADVTEQQDCEALRYCDSLT